MGRAPCCDKANVKRGPWSPEEDATLKTYLQAHGTGGNWIALPRKAGLRRCGKSCRLRWLNYLRPDIKHGGFTDDEDRIICNLYNQMGSRWSVIASQLPGRTDNDVKNYWNTKLKKKLLAGKISLTTNTTTTSNGPLIPTNNANTNLPESDLESPSFPLLQPALNSCPLDSSISTNSEHQNSSTFDNPGLITAHDQRLPFQCDPNPRIMDFSADQFDHVRLTKNNTISYIYNNVSSSQDSSSYNCCDGYTGGNSTASTRMDFGFGLPYDIIDGVSFD